MRLRNVPGAAECIQNNPHTIQSDDINAADYKGHWNDTVFLNSHPIHMEIGMGKGQFITRLAAQNPSVNYIGIEKYSSVLVRALDKTDALGLQNLMLLRLDADRLTEFFAPGEVEKIYLNFSDPWPKDRHAKRRLTHACYLAKYDAILTREGSLEFKTDNRPLFDFSLEQLNAAGWTTDSVCFDLHQNGAAPDNIMTEYEEKFFKRKLPICKLTAHH